MSVLAPKEIPGIPVPETGKTGVTIDVPTSPGEIHGATVSNITTNLQDAGLPVTTEDVTPSAPHPVPNSSALKQINAERVGDDLPLNFSDLKHGISTIGTPVGGVSPNTFDRTSPGAKVISFMKDKARIFRNARHQANKEAA